MLHWKSDKYYTFWVFLASAIQHSMRVRRSVLSPVAWLALQYFCTLSHKRQDIRKKVIEYKTCVLISSTTSVSLTLSRIERGIRNIHTLSCKKNSLLLPDFNKIWLSWQIFKKYYKINFYENLSSGSRAVCMRMERRAEGRTDGQADTTKPKVAFCNFTNAPKTVVISSCEHMPTQKCTNILKLNLNPPSSFDEIY
jgi:hypothetical protein